MSKTIKVSDLIRQGRHEEVWQRFCGFLDLTLPEFMEIQERLLREQLLLVGRSRLGRILMGDNPPQDVEEFRRRVRLTTYEDYAPYLDEQQEDVLAEKPVAWAHTSGRSGRYKWAPFTARAFAKIGEGALTWAILGTARRHGEVCVEPDDVWVYNVAARPYISGYGALSLAELFDFRYVPSVEEMERMSFQERIQAGFQMGLRTGIDIIGSISSVLVKIGEQFAKGASGAGFTPTLLHPAVLFRLGRALLRSRLAGRPLLPKDLWQVKGVLVGGTDTAIYRQKVIEYWGVEPCESYGCTEAPAIMAIQTWSGKEGLYFLPDVCFYEFVPEAEWARWRADNSYIPQTVLLDEVKVGDRYEVVISNFYGGPFLRYRLHDLVRFTSLRDEEAGIKLPGMIFAGRDADLIDLAGFTGLIDEKLVWQAIENTGVPYAEWAVRKELLGEHANLHLYIELKETLPAEAMAQRVHEELKALNPFYKDLARFLEIRPLRVTLLSPGTFLRYMRERQAAGADLAHLKPPHMNAPDAVMADLLRLS
jgi:hypothetical protein